MSRNLAPHALIVAAHGSHRRPRANQIVRGLALRLQQDYGWGQVAAAFWQGRPSFSQVLDETPARRYTVLPLLTADGHYSRRVLPRELAKNRRFHRRRVHIVPPLGLRPEILPLAENRSRILLNRFGLSGGRTTLIAIGHGTRRHPQSRASTLELVGSLKRKGPFRQVLPAFLDDSPAIEEALAQALGEAVILLPFLIGGTFHALRDIPEAVGVDPGLLPHAHNSQGLPQTPAGVLHGERLLVFDRAIGEDPSISRVLARMAADSPWACREYRQIGDFGETGGKSNTSLASATASGSRSDWELTRKTENFPLDQASAARVPGGSAQVSSHVATTRLDADSQEVAHGR